MAKKGREKKGGRRRRKEREDQRVKVILRGAEVDLDLGKQQE